MSEYGMTCDELEVASEVKFYSSNLDAVEEDDKRKAWFSELSVLMGDYEDSLTYDNHLMNYAKESYSEGVEPKEVADNIFKVLADEMGAWTR